MQQIIAFSSSRVANGAYLEKAVPVINSFLGKEFQHIAFIPFASVENYHDYGEKVSEAMASLPCTIHTASRTNVKELIEKSDVIMVGGGNTFKLLHDLYESGVVELIKEKVQNGTPYIGWSAGSNLTGPTICTTNDMPIIEPESFAAFGFYPFQINPHYHNMAVEGFHGETRDQRLEEFLKLNPTKQIVCLPEGTAIQTKEGKSLFKGDVNGTLMYNGNEGVLRKKIQAEMDMETLLKSIQHNR